MDVFWDTVYVMLCYVVLITRMQLCQCKTNWYVVPFCGQKLLDSAIITLLTANSRFLVRHCVQTCFFIEYLNEHLYSLRSEHHAIHGYTAAILISFSS